MQAWANMAPPYLPLRGPVNIYRNIPRTYPFRLFMPHRYRKYIKFNRKPCQTDPTNSTKRSPNVFVCEKMKLRPSRTMSVIIGGLFLAAIVSVPFANGQQCDCASSVPKCKPLPAQNSGLDSPCKKVPRSDCPCCLVCAGQLDDPCYPESQPCDTYKGLICDSTTDTVSYTHLTLPTKA